MESGTIILSPSEQERELARYWDQHVGAGLKNEVYAIARDNINGVYPQARPLPGPIEALRAWCLTRGVFKGFWQTM